MDKRDLTTFVDNITILAKVKHIKIGDLEKTCGVSHGYFSRLKKSNNMCPSLNVAINISEILDTTIEDLLYTDYAAIYKKNIRLSIKELYNMIQDDSLNDDELIKEAQKHLSSFIGDNNEN